VLQAPLVAGQRSFSTSATAGSGSSPSPSPGSASARGASPAGPADATAKARGLVLYVQREGAAKWAKVAVAEDWDVMDLTESIKTMHPSLHDKDADTLALHVATVDQATQRVLAVDDKPLLSRTTLADLVQQGKLAHGASIVVRVAPPLPAFPPLPPPITFTSLDLGGQRWMVARLSYKDGVTVPVYLTVEQHAELERFIGEGPAPVPQVLMPVGTIKSGKSTILQQLIPGMLAAAVATRWPSTRRRPVLFNYKFPLGSSAEGAAMHLTRALYSFAQAIKVPFAKEATAGDALDNLPENVRKFAERIKAGGGELWLLLDELQAPGLGSTPTQAQRFTYVFKDVSRTDRHRGG